MYVCLLALRLSFYSSFLPDAINAWGICAKFKFKNLCLQHVTMLKEIFEIFSSIKWNDFISKGLIFTRFPIPPTRNHSSNSFTRFENLFFREILHHERFKLTQTSAFSNEMIFEFCRICRR